MPTEWHYSIGDDRHGPVSARELKELADSGQLQPSCLVWKEGMPNWVQANKVKGLFIASTSATPPPLPSAPTGSQGDMPNIPAELKFAWAKWSVGGKVIFVSACVGVMAMFVDWVDVGIASANGFSQGAFLLIGIFIYPVLVVFRRKPMHPLGGLLCGAAGIVCAVSYILSKNIEVFDRSVNAAAGGPYIFLLSCAALIVGVTKYQPRANDT